MPNRQIVAIYLTYLTALNVFSWPKNYAKRCKTSDSLAANNCSQPSLPLLSSLPLLYPVVHISDRPNLCVERSLAVPRSASTWAFLHHWPWRVLKCRAELKVPGEAPLPTSSPCASLVPSPSAACSTPPYRTNSIPSTTRRGAVNNLGHNDEDAMGCENSRLDSPIIAKQVYDTSIRILSIQSVSALPYSCASSTTTGRLIIAIPLSPLRVFLFSVSSESSRLGIAAWVPPNNS